jgi:osmotically-inducible protein OsmY
MQDRLLRRRMVLTAGGTLPWLIATAWGAEGGSRLAREVQNELAALPYYTVFDNIDFRVMGETVTLLGQVTKPVLKGAAEKAVKQIEGVRRVENQIEVLQPSKSDDRIRLAEYGATYGQPTLSQYATRAVAPVHIIVKNGNVTLEGKVDIASDKAQFFTQASGVPGIVSVTDHLKVAP